MTIQDTGTIMRILKANYPNWNAGKDTMILWSQMFADDDVKEVSAAVKAFIAMDDKGFAPVIGQIKQLIIKTKRMGEMTEQEAWALVRSAISNGIYGCYEEFEKLPPVLQRVVGDPEQLSRWAMLEDGLDTVVASNVMRSYRKAVEQEQFEGALPTDVRLALTGSQKLLGGEL